MHGWVDSEIHAVLLALIVIVFVSLAFAHQVTSKSIQRLTKNQKIGIATETLVEKKEQSKLDYKSMLVTNSACAVCKKPSNRRCSRCKSARYCSSECQVIHWKEGHKNKCHAPAARSLCNTSNESGVMCNGKHLETLKNVKSTIVLNPISLGFFKNDSKNLNDGVKKSLPSRLTKALSHALTTDGNLPRPHTLLFPYDYFVKLFEWDILSVPCGLINCGNSCFANVVLQCLTYTRPLTAYLVDGCHSDDCRRKDWCFMCELQNHVCKVRQKQNPFSPIRILSRIRNIGNHLGYGRQEDAHEFMRFAIDSMQSICLDEVGGEKAVDAATQETTLIHHIFGGHLQSQVKCMQCHHESNRYESMMDLAVEIHGVVESLEDAIAQFTTTEMLDGDNKYKCDRCNAYVRARKRLTIYEAPNILTIALKRFQSGKFGKLNKRVTYPEVLDMSPYMSGNNNEPSLYKLYAVVVHVDMLNASFFGHYICYVKDSNGVWYKIDDSKVKDVEPEKVMIQRAYMLFYSRTETRKGHMIGHPSTTSAASFSAAKNIHTSVCMEPQRSSIFPPTFGAVPVPTDIYKDYFNENKPNCLKIFEADIEVLDQQGIIEIEYENVEETIEDGDKTIIAPTSTIVSKGELAAEPTFCVGFGSIIDTVSYSASNGASTSPTMNSTLPLNNNFGQNGPPLDATNNNLDMERPKYSPPLSTPKCLDINQPEVFPMVDYSSLSPRTHVQENMEIFLYTNEWVGDVEYLCPSNSHSLSNTFAKKEEHNSNETNVWNNVSLDKAKKQHVENTFGRLECEDTNLNGHSLHMDMDEGHTLSVGVLDPYKSLKRPSNGDIGFSSVIVDNHTKIDNEELFQSSKVLLDLESLSSQNTLDIERVELTLDIKKDMSITRVTRSGLEIHEESYELESLEDDTPYVVVKPLLVEPTIAQFYEEPSLQQHDNEVELVEASTLDMHDTNNVASRKEQRKTSEPVLDIKPKKYILKPLFSRGFLSMSPRLTSPKFLNESNNGVANGRHRERNGHGQSLSVEAKHGQSNGRPAMTLVNCDTDMELDKLNTNNKLSNQVETIAVQPTSNGNQSNEELILEKKFQDLLLDSQGRDNGVSIFVDQSGSLKEGRNNTCVCGSQLKWKKCCGKATILKGEPATKHVKV